MLWLDPPEFAGLWNLDAVNRLKRLYLSTTLYGTDPAQIPTEMRDRVYLVHPYESPGEAAAAATAVHGLAQGKRINAPDAQLAQADAFFALKTGGSAVVGIRGFFLRDYLLERIEHLIDRASYTGVYPRISLAPGQRFISRSAYIARFPADATGAKDLTPVTDWAVPGSNEGGRRVDASRGRRLARRSVAAMVAGSIRRAPVSARQSAICGAVP